MRHRRIVTVTLSLSVGLAAACTVPSEPVSAGPVAPNERTPASVVQNSPDDPRSSQRIRYEIPPGTHQLRFDVGVSGHVQGLQFSFTGRNHFLRIRRVRDNCGSYDLTFADATLHQATQFFDENPITASTNVFHITVENSSQEVLRLQVTARFDWSNSSPPCGL